MAEEVPQDISREENQIECCFGIEKSYTNRLLENTLPTSIPCLCNSGIITTTSCFLSSWEPCENHKGHDGTSTDEFKGTKKRHTQRFPGPGSTLPFGHDKKTEFVFQHYHRRDMYIEQYRYQHTYGGTGKSLRNSQIAQTLISYLKNGQLKFPVIRQVSGNKCHI